MHQLSRRPYIRLRGFPEQQAPACYHLLVNEVEITIVAAPWSAGTTELRYYDTRYEYPYWPFAFVRRCGDVVV